MILAGHCILLALDEVVACFIKMLMVLPVLVAKLRCSTTVQRSHARIVTDDFLRCYVTILLASCVVILLHSWMFGSPKANPSTAPAKLLFPDDADNSSSDSDSDSRKRSGSSSSAKKGAIADTDSSSSDSNMGPSRIDDGLLEVVAVTGALHLGQIQVGLGAGHPIAQCNELKITTSRKLPMQGASS